MQLEGRAHGDDRAARIVHPLAQQVLAETAALAFDHIGQRLQGTLVGTGHGFAAATVVEQTVHGLLQHALFIARDDLRRLQLQQTAQTAVAVDHSAVQVVQVRGGEAATVQGHQGAQIRWQHRQHRQHHPLGLDARLLESLQHFEALGVFLHLDFRPRQVTAKALDFGFDFDAFEQLTDAFGTHLGHEFVTILFELGVVVVFGHDAVLFEGRHARVGHHIGFEIKHTLNVAQGHVQHQAQTAGQGLQEPNVRTGRGQVDVAHAFTAHFGLGDFNATLLANHATVFQAFVFAAQAFVVLDGAKNLGAKQAVALGLESAVVDGFRLFDFAKRPGTDFLWGSQSNFDGIKMLIGRELLEQVE